jgi:hypothetical protein
MFLHLFLKKSVEKTNIYVPRRIYIKGRLMAFQVIDVGSILTIRFLFNLSSFFTYKRVYAFFVFFFLNIYPVFYKH